MKKRLVRFGVSLEDALLKRFDAFVLKEKLPSRSKAIEVLIRKELVCDEFSTGGIINAAITVVYDHHKRELLNNLLDLEHDYSAIIISSQHIHMDHDNCMEIIALKGKAQKIKNFFEGLKSIKGVKHSTLSITASK